MFKYQIIRQYGDFVDSDPLCEFNTLHNAMEWLITKTHEYSNYEWMDPVGPNDKVRITLRVKSDKHIFYRLCRI